MPSSSADSPSEFCDPLVARPSDDVTASSKPSAVAAYLKRVSPSFAGLPIGNGVDGPGNVSSGPTLKGSRSMPLLSQRRNELLAKKHTPLDQSASVHVVPPLDATVPLAVPECPQAAEASLALLASPAMLNEQPPLRAKVKLPPLPCAGASRTMTGRKFDRHALREHACRAWR